MKRPHGPVAWSATILLAVLLVLNALVLVSAARTRADFCDWARAHYQAARQLPQTPPRQAVTQSDEQLVKRLGC